MRIKLDPNAGSSNNMNNVAEQKSQMSNSQNSTSFDFDTKAVDKEPTSSGSGYGSDSINVDEFGGYNDNTPKQVEVDGIRLKEKKELDKEDRKKSRKEKQRDKRKKILNTAPKTNEDYYENYKKRIQNNRIKRITIYGSMIGILAMILIFNFYFVFIREVTPIENIALKVKELNHITTYPKEDVQGYLNTYADDLIADFYEYSSGTGANVVNVSSVMVERISVKTDSNAQVYFSAKINTNVGSSVHNFVLPLYYDHKEKAFHPSGNLVIAAAYSKSDVEDIEASSWSFGKIKKYSREETEVLSNYLSNFFEILYNKNDNDITTFYSGSELIGDKNMTFIGIEELSYYKENNALNSNCKVIYTCKSTEGLTYHITNYLLVKNIGEGKFEVLHIY